MDYTYFTKHPLRVAKPQRHVSIGELIKADNYHQEGLKMLRPTVGAYIHYGGVELADKLVLQQPDMSQDDYNKLCSAWNKSCGTVARSLLFYLWRICIKELRHAKHHMIETAFGDNWQGNPHAVAIYKVGTGSDYMKSISKNGILAIGPLFDAVCKHYHEGGWLGSFGGEAWGIIADQFREYLDGNMSAMLACDRCWTLVHNTGPIFNKGFYFKIHDDNLEEVLNAQAKSSVFDMSEQIAATKAYTSYEVYEQFMLFKTIAEAHLNPTEVVEKKPKKSTATRLERNTTAIGPIRFTHLKEA